MTTNTTYIELLKLAHESLDSKDAEIAELKAELLGLRAVAQSAKPGQGSFTMQQYETLKEQK
jgi:ribosomal protein L29